MNDVYLCFMANQPLEMVPGVVLGILAALIILTILLCWCRWSRLKSGNDARYEGDKKAMAKIRSTGSGHRPKLFTYKELEHATEGFSTKHELGGGGFGTVYRGKLANGQLVAVKKLNQGGSQGHQQFLNEVEVLIGDAGKGMTNLEQASLFRPFYSTKGDYGNGLGLYISNEIAERHDGRFLVESVVGNGTIVRLRLPLVGPTPAV